MLDIEASVWAWRTFCRWTRNVVMKRWNNKLRELIYGNVFACRKKIMLKNELFNHIKYWTTYMLCSTISKDSHTFRLDSSRLVHSFWYRTELSKLHSSMKLAGFSWTILTLTVWSRPTHDRRQLNYVGTCMNKQAVFKRIAYLSDKMNIEHFGYEDNMNVSRMFSKKDSEWYFQTQLHSSKCETWW